MTTQTIAAEARAVLARERTKQSDVAEALGLSRSQLSRRLSGQISFSAEEIAHLAQFAGVPVGQFFGAVAS